MHRVPMVPGSHCAHNVLLFWLDPLFKVMSILFSKQTSARRTGTKRISLGHSLVWARFPLWNTTLSIVLGHLGFS